MKKAIFFISVLFVFAIMIFYSCNSNTGEMAVSKEDSVRQLYERGNYLVHSVVNCIDCHSSFQLTKFSLPIVPGSEGGGGFPLHLIDSTIPGIIYIPNITPYRLKDWTDEEIARAITKGINKNGDTLFPIMPYHGLSRLAPEDVDAIVTYIRSLKPIEDTIPARQMFVPMAMFGPLPDNDYKANKKPDTTDLIKYGEYLVTIAHCTDCHTPFTKEGPPDMTKYFAGGQHFNLPAFSVTVANITPDSATGIGSWTEEMFIKKFRENASQEKLNSEPGKLNTIMPWSFFGTMKEHDLKAIYAYLRSIPPVNNKIVKWQE